MTLQANVKRARLNGGTPQVLNDAMDISTLIVSNIPDWILVFAGNFVGNFVGMMIIIMS
mgnify:CR=1 FL=1